MGSLFLLWRVKNGAALKPGILQFWYNKRDNRKIMPRIARLENPAILYLGNIRSKKKHREKDKGGG